MDDRLKSYVKKNLDLIDANDYETLYKNISQAYRPPMRVLDDVGELTEFLLKCDIKPDEYMLEIPNAYLYGITTISKYSISTNITKISSQAFEYCSIESIYIPDSVCEIGAYAFAHCTNLTSITIPSGVTYLGCGTFEGCKSLKDVTIPDSVTDIERDCFKSYWGACSITTATIPAIAINPLPKWNLETVVITSGNIIPEYSFAQCDALKSITIPNGVTNIGADAFSGCSSLTSIIIPDKLINISERTFYNCTSLTNINIPDSIESIEKDAFSHIGELEITYQGTTSNWKKLYKPEAFRGTYFTVNCTDGKIVKKKK